MTGLIAREKDKNLVAQSVTIQPTEPLDGFNGRVANPWCVSAPCLSAAHSGCTDRGPRGAPSRHSQDEEPRRCLEACPVPRVLDRPPRPTTELASTPESAPEVSLNRISWLERRRVLHLDLVHRALPLVSADLVPARQG